MQTGGPSTGGGIRAKVVLGLVAFLALTWVVLMYSPLAHPRDLEVDGATGLSADKIQAAIEETAREQSTFRVSEETLMAAVADFPEVAAIEIDAHPPFRLDLTVVMRPPVGRVQIGGRTFTVAGDGTVLQRASEAAVPKLDPSLGALTLRDGRLTGDGGALPVLAAAPETFMDLIRAVRRGSAGIEVELQRGPRLIFGSAELAADKWAAATAVIADGAATRATYIDVRVPGRPAVGGLGGSKTAAEADAPPSLVAAPQASTETAAAATGQGAATTSASGATEGAAEAPASSQSAPPAQTQASAPEASAPSDGGDAAPAAPVGPGASAPASGTGAPAAASGGGASLAP